MSRNYRPKNITLQVLIAMILAAIATFLTYIIGGYVVVGILEEEIKRVPHVFGDTVAKILIAVIFSCYFHVLYTLEQNKTYSQSGINTSEPFDIKNETLNYFKKDAVPFLKVYGILAIVQWLFYTLYFFTGIGQPIFIFFLFVFPLQPDAITSMTEYLLASLVSPVASFLVMLPIVILLAVISRRNMYKKFRGKR